MRRISIGLLGCGTVGRGFVELVGRERERIRGRDGIDLQIRKILVRDEKKGRPNINPSLFTTSAVDVLDDGCDVVVELVGGVHCAGAYVRRAIANGRNVVTANKALLAECGHELFDAAARQRLRRHTHRPRADARPGRRSRARDQRHLQRHVQLHPDPHGAGRSRLRRRAAAGAGAGICGSGSLARRRRPRRRAEAAHPRGIGVWTG